MKALHVVATVDDLTAGPSHSVTALCRALAVRGAEIEVHTVDGWRSTTPAHGDLAVHRHAQDFAAVPVLKQLCLSSALNAALKAGAPGTDILHAHGLWLAPNVYPASAVRGSAARLVLSPRGMLGEAALGFSSGKKALFWALAQKRAVAAAHCLHATGEAEYAEIRRFGISNPVAIIPNGVDIPEPRERSAQAGERTLLTLGRIHPKKGLPNLLHAWAALQDKHPGWRLRIVGPNENGHAEELAALGAALGLQRLSIEPPLLGPAKTAAYQKANLFVLPTLNENFAMTVAEALAAGTPVVASKGAPWSGLVEQGCGWWVDIGAEPLAGALDAAMRMPAGDLSAMGDRGRRWMTAAYSWPAAATAMLEVYGWFAQGGPPPAFVRLD